MYVYTVYTYILLHRFKTTQKTYTYIHIKIMVQIYEDTETKKLIEQLRKEDPSINLSDIFKISLQRFKEDRFGQGSDRLVVLSKMLEKARFEQQQVHEQIDYITEEIQIEKNKIKQEKEKEESIKINISKLNNERIKETLSNLLVFYPDINDIKIKEQLAKDLVENYWGVLDFFDYMEMKGYNKIKGTQVKKLEVTQNAI